MRGLRQSRLSFVLLLATVLLVRALVPTGWMPTQAGGLAIAICTSQGVADAWVDAQGKIHTEKQHKPGDSQNCDFAPLGAAADRVAGPVFVEPALLADDVPRRAPLTVYVGRGLAAPPPPATGPPLLN